MDENTPLELHSTKDSGSLPFGDCVNVMSILIQYILTDIYKTRILGIWKVYILSGW